MHRSISASSSLSHLTSLGICTFLSSLSLSLTNLCPSASLSLSFFVAFGTLFLSSSTFSHSAWKPVWPHYAHIQYVIPGEAKCVCVCVCVGVCERERKKEREQLKGIIWLSHGLYCSLRKALGLSDDAHTRLGYKWVISFHSASPSFDLKCFSCRKYMHHESYSFNTFLGRARRRRSCSQWLQDESNRQTQIGRASCRERV